MKLRVGHENLFSAIINENGEDVCDIAIMAAFGPALSGTEHSIDYW